MTSKRSQSAAISGVWLGIDLGTTSVKVVLLDSRGDVVASDCRSTEAEIDSDVGRLGNEQDPWKVLKTVMDITIPILKDKTWDVRGIGITGQMHGVVLWGQETKDESSQTSSSKDNEEVGFKLGQGIQCSHLYTWQDQRCSQEFLASLPPPSNPGLPLATGHGCATLYWLARHRPDLVSSQGFTNCGTIMDLLAFCLCDLQQSVTSEQLAASFGYYCQDTGQWDVVLYEDSVFPSQLLPKIVPLCSEVGHTRPELFDWPSQVPVYVSMGDVQCATFALLRDKHDAAMNISTSVQLGFVMSPQDVHRLGSSAPSSLSVFPYFDSQCLCLCAGLNGGNSLRYLAQCLANWVTQLGFAKEVSVSDILDKLQNLAEEENPPEEKLTFRPSFYGERHETSLRGSISGLSGGNLANIGAVFRAASQGLVDHLHHMVPAHFLTDVNISRLLVSGSVVTKNSILKERLVELYSGKSLEVVFSSQGNEAVGSAVGAAAVVLRNVARQT